MRKTPAYLKGLAETRARAAGDVERLTAIEEQVVQQLAKAREELEACDLLIQKFDQRLDPTQIRTVHANGRYGKRGELRDAIITYLKERAPAEVTTFELSVVLQARFQFSFITRAERLHWQTNSLTRQLKKLVVGGTVERLHDPSGLTWGVGRWRWKSDAKTLDEWQTAAAEAAV